jgi:hypothetical protein
MKKCVTFSHFNYFVTSFPSRNPPKFALRAEKGDDRITHYIAVILQSSLYTPVMIEEKSKRVCRVATGEGG